jgi:hypothetical protein
VRTDIAVIAANGYFASGLQEPGEIRGVTMAGYHVGISCSTLRRGLLDTVERAVKLLGVQVFVDSGAFSEVREVNGQLVPRRTLSDADWELRMRVYERLAKSCGKDAWLVAPDKVGDQFLTLERLRRWAPRLRAMLRIHGDPSFGPQLIVPLQKGAMTLSEFAQAACEALGLSEDEVVWGLPSKKAATTLQGIADFARTCTPDARFHLLGMSPFNEAFEPAVTTLRYYCPEASITCDAVRQISLVGRKRGLKPLTAAQDEVRRERPHLTPSQVKRYALYRVLGNESVALLRDNGWSDPELATTPVTVPREGPQLSLLGGPA